MSYPPEGLQRVHSVQSWRTLRPIKAALERLGIPVTMGQGTGSGIGPPNAPELLSTPEGARLAAAMQIMVDISATTYTCETLEQIAARLTTEDINAFEAAWKLDAPVEVLAAMLNPQQESKP
jgi:hypothetical protein